MTYKELRSTVLHHAYLYYIKNEPEISDAEYDKLFHKLVALEESSGILEENRITNKVACGLKSTLFTKVRHKYPMLSLSNAFSVDDYDAWVKSNNIPTTAEIVVTPKLDGASLSLIYQDRVLIQGLRRGDGIEGDDITSTVREISNIPVLLRETFPTGRLEVRGEVMCPAFNSEFADKYKNHRNYVSGSLNLKNPAEVSGRKLMFYAHKMISELDEPVPTMYSTRMEFLEKEAGISTVFNLSVILSSIGDFDIESVYLTTLGNVNTDQYPIDGLVVMLNDIELFNELGATSHHPRGALAIKTATEEKETRIVEVEWQVGKTGTITPVAILQPVELNGTTVKRCTLHNIDEVDKLDVAINDLVLVTKAAFIIPKILKVVERPANRGPIRLLACPSCGTKTVKEGPFLKCKNKDCSDQLTQQLVRFSKALRIVGLGERTIENLVHLRLVTDIYDLVTLSEEKLERATKSELVANKVKTSLDNRLKNASFAEALSALNIPLVNLSSAQKLIDAGITTVFELKDRDRIKAIHGFGEKKASMISGFVLENYSQLEKLSKILPLAMTSLDKVSDKENVVNIAITGTVSVSRSAAKHALAKHGYSLQNTVTTKTQLLLVGKNPGKDKLEKANTLGIPVVDYKDSQFTSII